VSEELPYKELEGAFVTLMFREPSAELAEALEGIPVIRDLTGIVELPFNEETLEHLIVEEDSFKVWELIKGADNERMGFVFFVMFDGPPFIALYLYGGPDLNMAKDCIEQLVPVFFHNVPEESSLFYYEPRPIDEEIHAALIDAGFDHWDENPTIDNETVACYVLERHTYDAYYGNEQEFEQGDEDY